MYERKGGWRNNLKKVYVRFEYSRMTFIASGMEMIAYLSAVHNVFWL